ncbi:MAG: hypothetical protein H7Y28_16405 [Rhodoferax sp.]|nr:hypothetical protein [Rhodoferax sp.]
MSLFIHGVRTVFAVLGLWALTACGTPAPVTPSLQVDSVVAPQQVASNGRMRTDPRGGWLATWPGVHWTLRFSGRAVGVEIDDRASHWLLEIDGQPVRHIAPDAAQAQAQRTVWVRDLAPGEHTARLLKRTESPQAAGRFVAFHLGPGAVPLAPKAALPRRIEFIGDSFTAAMGNMSNSRECSGPEISARTDITQGFAVLTARALHADWQIHAKSGAGLVRNWAGKLPLENHGTHYAKTLQTDAQPTAVWDWQPQVVVIGLGTNDFSTPVEPGEPRDAAELERAFVTQYKRLITQLRYAYRDPVFVLLSLPLHRGDKLRPIVQRLVQEENAAGFTKVVALDWGPLQVRGCGSHPDAEDHRHMARLLTHTIRTALPGWNSD